MTTSSHPAFIVTPDHQVRIVAIPEGYFPAVGKWTQTMRVWLYRKNHYPRHPLASFHLN